MKKHIQIVGPFFTNYSLARVNRGLAIELSKIFPEILVSFSLDQQHLDYIPNQYELEKKQNILQLVKNAKKSAPEIVIFNNFPKISSGLLGLSKLPGKVKLIYLAWEESVYPRRWVDEINDNCNGVMVISSFVKKILINSGIKIPIEVVNIAPDNEFFGKNSTPVKLKTKKKFKFLHISTAKKRKGVDLLIRSFFNVFKSTDDVVLIIKTSHNPNNDILDIIKTYKKNDSPEIEIISEDLLDTQIKWLHEQCDAEVYPSRAEGFGLPVLESMLLKKPVITTNYGGTLDFCNEKNSYLIDYTIQRAIDSEQINPGAKWAEPDLGHLSSLLKQVYQKVDSAKIEKAYKKATLFTWKSAAKKVFEFANKVEMIAEVKNKKLAVLSFFNSESGIADYTEDLYQNIECCFKKIFYVSNSDISDRTKIDSEKVFRTWETGEIEFKETLDFLKREKIDIFHIQYHSGAYFPPSSLDNLILKCNQNSIKTFVTLHAVMSKSFNFIDECKKLSLAEKVFIHNKLDYEYAKKRLNNVELFLLPAIEVENKNKSELKRILGLDKYSPIIVTHGLLNTNKNVLNILKAVEILKKEYPNIFFIALCAVSVNNIYAKQLLSEIKNYAKKVSLEQNFVLFTDFLRDELIKNLLNVSDINVWAYTEVGESSSASVRKALASGNPTIVTDIKMFSELKDEVLKIPSPEVLDLVEGIKKILSNPPLQRYLKKSSIDFGKKHSNQEQAIKLLNIYKLNL